MWLRGGGLIFCFVSLMIGLAATPHSLRADRLPTVAEKLREHHIELSRDSLISALSNSDPEVRYLAAEQLYEDKATDAVPIIEKALTAEQVPAAKVNIAFALALLHSKLGDEALKNACGNPAFPSYLKLRAASYLLTLKSDACFNTVMDALKSSNDTETRIGALSLVPQLIHVSERDSQTLYPFVLAALDDSTPAVRLSASSTLALIGNLSAIPYIEHAIAVERDETVRVEITRDLDTLKEKQKQQEQQRK